MLANDRGISGIMLDAFKMILMHFAETPDAKVLGLQVVHYPLLILYYYLHDMLIN